MEENNMNDDSNKYEVHLTSADTFVQKVPNNSVMFKDLSIFLLFGSN